MAKAATTTGERLTEVLGRVTMIASPAVILVCTSTGTPQFAREYGLECSKCHIHVPKLNDFGEKFLASGYSLLGDMTKRPATPIAIWASGLALNRDEKTKAIPNRVEVISTGREERMQMNYFVEWRVLSREFLADGSVRDRSGRFEDAFVLLDVSRHIQLQVGQYRAMSQIDVSRRLSLSEPIAFSAGLPGNPSPDSRIQSLRSFSLAGRAPGVRGVVAYDGWFGALTVPFPGEFSIPLTREARRTASFEFEGEPKGALLEVYRRDGIASYGVQGFWGNNGRQVLGLAAQQNCGRLFFEGGISHVRFSGSDEWRYSLGTEWIQSPEFALGFRADHRQVSGQKVSFSPYISLFRAFGDQAAKVVFEGRIQEGSGPRWNLELSWFF